MLTFCINLTANELFKIAFLFETTFIFPQQSLSREACMIYPDCYWINAYLLPFVGMSTLLWLGAWNFLSMVIIFEYFKCKPHCANIQNLFKNRIFVISVKNCTLQLNFKAHLLLIKIRLINAKNQIQPRWRPSSPAIPAKSKLSAIISGQCLCISRN